MPRQLLDRGQVGAGLQGLTDERAPQVVGRER